MRIVRFYARDTPRRKGDNVLHIETDGCIVNIRVGLTDRHGRPVTAVSILPDDEVAGGDLEGRIWRRQGDRIVQLKGRRR